jgi:hypothetical protein
VRDNQRIQAEYDRRVDETHKRVPGATMPTAAERPELVMKPIGTRMDQNGNPMLDQNGNPINIYYRWWG